MEPLPVIPFVRARNFGAGRGREGVRLVVIHSAEVGKTSGSAEALAAGFARRRLLADGRENKSSIHYCVDSDSIVQCVREEDVANHAPGVNLISVGIELAGYARQTAEEWDDEYNQRMLALAARLVAELCLRHGLPAEAVDAAGLSLGRRGVTTHAAVSVAFKKSNHTDPGPHFPMAALMAQVHALLRA